MEELIGARTTNIWQTDGRRKAATMKERHPQNFIVQRAVILAHIRCIKCALLPPLASTFNLLQQIKSDIVGTPRALKPLYLIHFLGWKNSLFPLLALWGNKNWPPSMKVKKVKIFQNKRGLIGCKSSSQTASGIENPLLHPTAVMYHFPISSINRKSDR